tara:strand:- start:418 stop:834 length:417 start_codon:yes stop_codon:yes gene_type:complete
MKVINKIFLIVLITVFSVDMSLAQDNKRSKLSYSKDFLETLSEYQKDLISKERKYLQKQREAIRLTFTNIQKEIIEDTSITRGEKKKLIIESFNEKQLDLIKRYETRIDTIRNKFYLTLNENQKTLLKKRRKKSKKND